MPYFKKQIFQVSLAKNRFLYGVILWLGFYCYCVPVSSQEINWASQVIDISSEYSGDEFSALQALGEPDAMWFGSKRSKAWLPLGISNKEFIVLGFDNPIKVNQVVIAESENPGAIKSIFFYDEQLYEYTHLELEPIRQFHQATKNELLVVIAEYNC